jgi:competence CoiA-like predicted nuclease
MEFALIDGARVTAQPGARGMCPSCGDIVVAKCGDIKQWHWAHASNDCDPWSEGMTEWHATWQECFPADWREVVIRKNGTCHRADVRLPNGRVIEFQHSSIGVQEIAEREAFYWNMLWVFDAREAYAEDRFDLRDRKTHYTFRWKYPRISIAFARSPVFLHLSNFWMLNLRKMSKATPCGGWGKLITVQSFAARYAPKAVAA